jgi:hypothetical protein
MLSKRQTLLNVVPAVIQMLLFAIVEELWSPTTR